MIENPTDRVPERIACPFRDTIGLLQADEAGHAARRAPEGTTRPEVLVQMTSSIQRHVCADLDRRIPRGRSRAPDGQLTIRREYICTTGAPFAAVYY